MREIQGYFQSRPGASRCFGGVSKSTLKDNMWKEFKTLMPYLRKYRWRYVIGLSFLIVVDAAQVAIPRFVKQVVDTISSGTFEMRDILIPVGWMIAVAAVISVGRFFWRYFIIGASRNIETELRDRLFGHLLEMDSDFYQANKTGDLMARATNDMNSVRMSVGMGFVSFVDGVFMSSMILIAMFASNPHVALYTCIPLPLVTILILFFGKMVGGRFRKVNEGYSKMSDIAQETMSGIRVIKAFVKEDHFSKKFAVANDEYSDSTMDLVKIFGFFFPLISFLSGVSTIILLSVGGGSVIGNKMSAGDIVAMLSYLEMLIWPLIGAGNTVNIIQRGATSLKRINQILNTKSGIVLPSDPITEKPKGGLDIKQLRFAYSGQEKPALADISLSLPRGSSLGILGRVGSGKSTLLKLLPRLLDPPPGTIFLDGKDIRDFDLATLRKSYGFVPQDSFLFSDSVRANIIYGAPDISEARFAEVAAISSIDRDIKLFPKSWDTVVGERGLTLSGGQKQRVAIARALAVDPEILVLDDALSAVDAETEDRILEALLEERKGKTTILVSHRVSTLRHTGLVIVLDSGRIGQSGSHEELLAQTEGFYAEIARLQELEAEAAITANGKGA